jgi:hypothetical protein
MVIVVEGVNVLENKGTAPAMPIRTTNNIDRK